MKRSVGLLIMTRIKGELVAVLQRRGEFNHEKMEPETWPGACQITTHGQINECEDVWHALKRELGEELGERTKKFFDIASDHIEILNKIASGDKEVTTAGIFVADAKELLETIQLNASSGGLRILQKDELNRIQNILLGYIKEKGIELRSTIVMFPDEIVAVKKAFEIFA
mgnify:FL=1